MEGTMTTPAHAPIVVVIDPGSSHRPAVAWGADEADRRHLPLRLLCVQSRSFDRYTPSHSTAERTVHEAIAYARSRHPRLEVSPLYAVGGLVPVLREQARTAALVVLGPCRSGTPETQVPHGDTHVEQGRAAADELFASVRAAVRARSAVAHVAADDEESRARAGADQVGSGPAPDDRRGHLHAGVLVPPVLEHRGEEAVPLLLAPGPFADAGVSGPEADGRRGVPGMEHVQRCPAQPGCLEGELDHLVARLAQVDAEDDVTVRSDERRMAVLVWKMLVL
jgi:hypothetical protein